MGNAGGKARYYSDPSDVGFGGTFFERVRRPGRTNLFVGWAERSEAQRARVMTLGFSRTKSGLSPTCAGGEQ